MAGSIKGLNIEIGGDTTQLTDALKKPAAETKNLKAELKNVNSALKFDTDNVDLLDQKQRLLAKTIDSTEEELKLLKTAQEQYIASGKDIDGAEYVVLENKIALASKSLEDLKKQQNNFSGELQALGLKATEAGEKTEALGEKFLPVTAGITAVATAAGAAWSELDEAYDTIAAGTGATGDALDELQDSFDTVFGSFPADAADASTAIADINTRFGLTGEALETASVQFLEFAKVNGSDVSTSIENVAKAMADAGIPAEELESTLDSLTAVSQASGMTTDELAAKLSENGVSMRQLGFDTETTLAMLATFEKNGVNTSTVLTGMKTAVKNFAKEGKDGAEEMQKFFEKLDDGSATSADAIEIFGSKAGAAIYEYAQEGKLNFEDLIEVAQNSAGQLSASFEEMQDPADSIQVALNNLKIAGASLFETVQTMAVPLLTKIVEKCQSLCDWFKSLSDGQKELIVKIGGIAAAIGPVLIGIGKLEKGFGSMISYLGQTDTLGGKLIASLKNLAGASSIGTAGFAAIAAGAAALVGAFVTLWNTNEDFRNGIIEIWEGISSKFQEFFQGITDRLNDLGLDFENFSEVVSALWNGFCELLAPVFTGVFEQCGSIISAFLDTVTGIIDILTGLFTGDWELLWQGVQEVFGAAWDYCSNTIDTITKIFEGLMKAICGWFDVDWKDVWEGIKQPFESAWKSVSDFGSKTWTTMKDSVSSMWDTITSKTKETWDGIKSKCTETWDSMKSGISSTWESIKSTTSDRWEGIKTDLKGKWDTIQTNADNLGRSICNQLGLDWDEIKNTASQKWNEVKENILSPFNSAKESIREGIESIKSFFNFQFQWPYIPMPHFHISGSLNPFDWFDGGLPTIGVDWYAKAMTNGTILNSPTIFGYQNGSFLGAGEAGSEVVVGLDSLKNMISNSVSTAIGNLVTKSMTAVQTSIESAYFGVTYEMAKEYEGTTNSFINIEKYLTRGLLFLQSAFGPLQKYSNWLWENINLCAAYWTNESCWIVEDASVASILFYKMFDGMENTIKNVLYKLERWSFESSVYDYTAQAAAAQLAAAQNAACIINIPETDYDKVGSAMLDAVKSVTVDGTVYLDKAKTGYLLADVIDKELAKAANRR